MSGFPRNIKEYQRVIVESEEKNSLREITCLDELGGGRSKARVFLVDVRESVSDKTQSLILKLDKLEQSARGESEKHNEALKCVPESFRKHMPEIKYKPVKSEGNIAILYEIAGGSLTQVRAVSSYLHNQRQLELAFGLVTRVLLEEFNEKKLNFAKPTAPHKVLRNWLKNKLLTTGGTENNPIDNFLRDQCNSIDTSTKGFTVAVADTTLTVPNSLHYLRNDGIWRDGVHSPRPITPIIGNVHGDLNTNNVLVKLFEGEPKDYYFIDFSEFGKKNLLFDNAYLEISHLLEQPAPLSDLLSLCFVITREKEASQHKIPVRENVPNSLKGAFEVIVSSRKSLEKWINQEQILGGGKVDDVWGQFWLACTAAGLNFCNKKALSRSARWDQKLRFISFVYACMSLNAYYASFGLKLGNFPTKPLELQSPKIKLPSRPMTLLSPSPSALQMFKKYPKECRSWRDNIIDGAIEILYCQTKENIYGGFEKDRIHCVPHNNFEWPRDVELDNRKVRLKEFVKGLVGTGKTKGWLVEQKSAPNRIRILLNAPTDPVLDRGELSLHFGNSDYFTVRTVTEISRREREGDLNGLELSNIFPARWAEGPGKPFPKNCVPYHVSAQGVLITRDPSTGNRYLILASANPLGSTLVYGWSATMAEQMQAPEPLSPFAPWWADFTKDYGVEIRPREKREGDLHIQDTLIRGLREEFGLEAGIHYPADPKLLNVCLEEDMFFITFIFFVPLKMSLKNLYNLWHKAPDHREFGLLAAYQIEGTDENGKQIDGPRAIARLLSKDTFDGGRYLIKNPTNESISLPWHITSRMRIYVAAYHLWGKKITRYVDIE